MIRSIYINVFAPRFVTGCSKKIHYLRYAQNKDTEFIDSDDKLRSYRLSSFFIPSSIPSTERGNMGKTLAISS